MYNFKSEYNTIEWALNAWEEHTKVDLQALFRFLSKGDTWALEYIESVSHQPLNSSYNGNYPRLRITQEDGVRIWVRPGTLTIHLPWRKVLLFIKLQNDIAPKNFPFMRFRS